VWVTVLLMAVVAGLRLRVAALVVMLSRSRPVRLLVAYLVGGFGVSMIVGAVIPFALKGIDSGSRRRLPADIDIAIGVVALLVAVVVGTGIAGRVRSTVQDRRTASVGTDADAVKTAAEEPHGIEGSAAFQKLPAPIQKALQRESDVRVLPGGDRGHTGS
jgi:hypothetical protein